MSSKVLKLLTENPYDLVSSNNSSVQSLRLVKQHLDSVIKSYKRLAGENGGDFKTGLDEIIVDGLDANQVWWQAKTVINNIEGDLINRIHDLHNIVSLRDQQENEEESQGEEAQEKESQGEEEISEREEEFDVNGASEEEENEEEENEEDNEQNDIPSDVYEDAKDNISTDHEEDIEEESIEESTKNELNDKFFDIEEFNRQTLALENGNDGIEDNEDDDIDYFGDIPSEDDEEALYYNDFFDQPVEEKKNKIKHISNDKKSEDSYDDIDELNESDYETAMDSAKLDLFEEEEEEEEEENGNGEHDLEKLSTFERQQLEIQKQIKQLEKEAIEEKKWALKGEVKAKDRPEDALLIEDLEFDRNSKPVPVITSSVTESLEEMIRDRIKNNNFDDLLKRTVVDLQNKKIKPEFELSDTKSSKSLAELYEDDYKGVDANMEISEELQKSHDEISELFANLTYKLDALSSAHFIPRPSKRSLEVRVDTAAITMEDAQPLTMSSASTLAPQEIYSVTRSDNTNEIRLKDGTTMSRDELSREDKTRLRRAVKRKRAKQLARQSNSVKKSKKHNIIETLSNAKNITIINKKGEKQDIKGNTVSIQNNNLSNIKNVKL